MVQAERKRRAKMPCRADGCIDGLYQPGGHLPSSPEYILGKAAEVQKAVRTAVKGAEIAIQSEGRLTRPQ